VPRHIAIDGVQKQLRREQAHKRFRLLEQSSQHNQGQEAQPGQRNQVGQLLALKDVRQWHASWGELTDNPLRGDQPFYPVEWAITKQNDFPLDDSSSRSPERF
jgi:hypothetical protein